MKIWLLKSCEESDGRYTAGLTEAGFSPVHVPTLTFSFVNQAPLKNALAKPEDYTGIIFTSPRAVEAVSQMYSTLKVGCHHEWTKKKVFAIGDATSNSVSNHLKLESIGKESGNAKQLAPVIFKEVAAFEKPLLYPCGNLGRDELPKLLVSQDRDFRALTCYETSQHPQLQATVQKLMADGLPSYIVFFSPSGVNFALSIFKILGLSLTSVKVIAIGPTTNAALVKEGIPVFGVCPTPSPEGLIHILKSPV